MQNSITVARYAAAFLIVLAIIGLGVWYFFIRSHTVTTQVEDVARGGTAPAPSFEGPAGSTYDNTVSSVQGTVAESAPKGAAPQLWHVTQAPVAGMGFVRVSGVPQLYFVERASGNVLTADPKQSLVTRLTNTLFPKTYSAIFANNGSVILRSVDDLGRITTFVGTISTSTTADATSSPLSLYGTSLETNIRTITLNPVTRELFYTMDDPAAGTIGISSQWNNTKQKRIFSSTIAGWQTRWLPDGRMFVWENPADNILGYAYELKKDGSLSSLVPGAPGLTILPRASSTAIIYGESTGSTLTLFARADTKSAPVILPIKTVADKCVWAPSKNLIAYCAVPQSLSANNYLDSWYQGTSHTSDTWYKVDVPTGTAEVLYSPQTGDNASIDVENPILDDSGHYLTFMNATDKTLWLLQITQS